MLLFYFDDTASCVTCLCSFLFVRLHVLYDVECLSFGRTLVRGTPHSCVDGSVSVRYSVVEPFGTLKFECTGWLKKT